MPHGYGAHALVGTLKGQPGSLHYTESMKSANRSWTFVTCGLRIRGGDCPSQLKPVPTVYFVYSTGKPYSARSEYPLIVNALRCKRQIASLPHVEDSTPTANPLVLCRNAGMAFVSGRAVFYLALLQTSV